MGSAMSYLPDHTSEQQLTKRRRINGQYSFISDCYDSIEQVTSALAQAGLESSNLIVGVDFTKSNEWTGKKSFDGLSLHNIGEFSNPYEQAISIIGQTLSKFDDDNLIPCFGFGDGSTQDRNVFSFYPDQRPCNGFTEVLSRYRELVPHVRLAGPTSFAPIIETAMSIVESSGGQYHVLLIIADGQVTKSVDTRNGELSEHERKTMEAIGKASELPLSIVLVGVGDGPWDTMKQFDDSISSRSFDNFQFVNFSEIMSSKISQPRKEVTFALRALMEIPSQYKATLQLGLLGRSTGKCPRRLPLPPPSSRNVNTSSTSITFAPPESTSLKNPGNESTASTSTAPPLPSSDDQVHVCPVCLVNLKAIAFGCGHQACISCSKKLQRCPICRSQIKTQIKLFY
ncbi:E3 ubiquitin-protein ligase RGLG2-like isoform X1 [Carex rostrata]